MQISQRLHFKWEICRKARQNGVCKPNESNFFPCQEACRKEHGITLIRFSRNANPYACMQCPDEHPSCVHRMRFENISLENFVMKTPKLGIWEPLCVSDSVEINHGVRIYPQKCVSCLLCVAYCPIFAVILDGKMKAHVCSPNDCSKSCIEACPVSAISLTSDFDETLFETLKTDSAAPYCEAKEAIDSIVKLDFDSFSQFSFDIFKALCNKLRDIDKFISWTGSALPRLFEKSHEIIVGFQIQVKEGWRPIRLELSIRDHLLNFFFFSKFKNNIEDFRFIDRHLLARKTIKHFLANLKKEVHYSDFLVVNYPEEKMFQNGLLVSSLFSRIDKYHLPLISLKTLYALLAFNLFSERKISLDKLYNLIIKQKKMYLLTADKNLEKVIKDVL
jgi:ferredoxin